MAAAYDAIARDYQRSKSSPLRAAIESWTIDRLLGDIRGQAIFDAGCGDGFHARRLMAAGASRIAGVDISAVRSTKSAATALFRILSAPLQ